MPSAEGSSAAAARAPAAFDGKLAAALGMLLIVFGVRGFLGSPLMPPSRIRIGGDGVRWGGLLLGPRPPATVIRAARGMERDLVR